MATTMTPFLTIEDGVLCLYGNIGDTVTARGVVEVTAALADAGDVLCSSTIDFAWEETKDAETVAFCRALRGGQWADGDSE